MKIQFEIFKSEKGGSLLKNDIYIIEAQYLTDSFKEINIRCFLDQRNNICFKGKSSTENISSKDAYNYIRCELMEKKNVSVVGKVIDIIDNKPIVNIESILREPKDALESMKIRTEEELIHYYQ